MNGGPGSSSMIGLFQENGPCFVNSDSNSTYINEWSWNNEVNMLYIDQPNQVGFSFDEPTNATVDNLFGETAVADFSGGVPEQNNTFYVGTISSMDSESTANSTMNAARALWHFSQVWFRQFPEYKPKDDRISIWTESYGGRYGPAFTSFFQEQNERIQNGTITDEEESFVLNLDTLGIINGCIDFERQYKSYLDFPFNNTYGIQAINETQYQEALDAWERPGGCHDQVQQCHRMADEGDPDFYGNNKTVNEFCGYVHHYCAASYQRPYVNSTRGYYDITHGEKDPFPPDFHLGYLSQPHVQAAIGTPVNFSSHSAAVSSQFRGLGDDARSHGYVDDIAYLLDSGVKVALVYGDRDYACNWMGGETISLDVDYSKSSNFRAAGYQDVQVNSSYVGGQVRQHGNFSFTRVFQAGHMIPAYQPEASYEIFQRIMFDRDIATGKINTAKNGSYSTTGSPTTFQVQHKPPPEPAPTCYILSLHNTCTEDHIWGLVNDTVEVRDYIVIDENSKHMFSDKDGDGGGNSDEPSKTNMGTRAYTSLGLLSSFVTFSISQLL